MWEKIISDLIASGLTQREIASRVGISQAHVSDLSLGRRGKRIGFEVGKALSDLHEHRCGKKRKGCAA